MRTIRDIIRNSERLDSRDREIGYRGVISSNSESFFARIFNTRDSKKFGPGYSEKVFTTFDAAIDYITKTIDARLAKLDKERGIK